MVKTASKMIPLGTKAPSFSLPDAVTGSVMNLEQLCSSKATVIMFICNHCPFVKHIQAGIVELANEFKAKGIAFIAISSNDVANFPDDSPELMKVEAENNGYPFPYLYDETQAVAKAYEATCTPDIFVFDGDLSLVYRGQLDDSRPGNNIPVTGSDLRAALNAILNGESPSADQKPSIGCNIKWKT